MEVAKQTDPDVIGDFETLLKPEDLVDEEKDSSSDAEIKKEEIKDCVKDLKRITST